MFDSLCLIHSHISFYILFPLDSIIQKESVELQYMFW